MSSANVTDFPKLVEDARQGLIRAATAAKLLGLASALSPRFVGSPKTLGELRAFSNAITTMLVAIGFNRTDVREDYADVREAAIVLNNRVWQAQRELKVGVEIVEVTR